MASIAASAIASQTPAASSTAAKTTPGSTAGGAKAAGGDDQFAALLAQSGGDDQAQTQHSSGNGAIAFLQAKTMQAGKSSDGNEQAQQPQGKTAPAANPAKSATVQASVTPPVAEAEDGAEMPDSEDATETPDNAQPNAATASTDTKVAAQGVTPLAESESKKLSNAVQPKGVTASIDANVAASDVTPPAASNSKKLSENPSAKPGTRKNKTQNDAPPVAVLAAVAAQSAPIPIEPASGATPPATQAIGAATAQPGPKGTNNKPGTLPAADGAPPAGVSPASADAQVPDASGVSAQADTASSGNKTFGEALAGLQNGAPASANPKAAASTATPAQAAPTAAQIASAIVAPQTGTQPNTGDTKSAPSDGTSPKAAAPAHGTSTRSQNVPAAQSAAAGSSTTPTLGPDSGSAAQAGLLTPGAAAPMAATLQVGPQTPAQHANENSPAQQAIPLNDLGALAVNIATRSQDGIRQFDIALHPAELGSINVHLVVDHSGIAQAHLSADNPQTLQLLQRDSQTLERSLRDAGLNLTGGGLNFSLKGQDRQGDNSPRTNGRGRNLSVSAVASAAAAPGMTSTYSLASDGARLDIRV